MSNKKVHTHVSQQDTPHVSRLLITVAELKAFYRDSEVVQRWVRRGSGGSGPACTSRNRRPSHGIVF